MSDKTRQEKERLMNEVLSKDKKAARANSEPVTLTLGNEDSAEKAKSSTYDASAFLSSATQKTNDLLRQADSAFDSLREILNKQQKDLSQISKENGYTKDQMEQVQRDIERDYGLTKEDVQASAETVEVPEDTSQVFSEIEGILNDRLVGEEDAIHAACAAFRRPYVMGVQSGQPKNVIVVSGPRGSGRHAIVRTMAESMKEKHLIKDATVSTLDLSLYTSASQEQVFLQDLYKALTNAGSVVCFENFETCHASFRRMINSLVVSGKTVLNKRYVLNKGILVENQTGLVKNTVDSLSADGKYLVFLTMKGTSAVQDAFGADFLYHVLDVITTKAFNDDNAREYSEICLKNFIQKVHSQLKLEVHTDDAVVSWVVSRYDKTAGADGIEALFFDFYISLSQEVLSSAQKYDSMKLAVQDDKPVAVLGEKRVSLSRSRTSSEEIEAVNKELDNIVGLDTVKDYIRSLQAHIQINELRRQQGMKVADISKHMIFTGNPGTGKTTIARLISRYMKAIGALSEGQLVEVTRADLVAQYVGQTAPLTMSVIKSALGGVLFIDEAYSLYRGKDDAFGLECIDTIVKAMEDNRSNLIVILAGYKKEMAGFLESNSGLKSRFPNIIDFPDYTGDQLLKIAMIQAKSKGYRIMEDAQPDLLAYFDKVQSINSAEAGNGRLARNVIEEAILKQADRLVKDPSRPMDELHLQDFDLTVKVKPAEEDLF
ncbi:MAG: AAA family ATPase [Bulleidia sp.]|nr:AAA family ATPase [Bulleidia sp.]